MFDKPFKSDFMQNFKFKALVFSALFIVCNLGAFAANGDPVTETISISKKQLKKVSVKELLRPQANSSVKFARISFNNEFNEPINYGIIDEQEPSSLRNYLARLKPGQKVRIENRFTFVDGKRVELPPLVYEIKP
jgi:hypothetical protein